MVQKYHQIHILLLISFALGVLSVQALNIFVLLVAGSLTYALPNILSFGGILELESYDQKQLRKMSFTLFAFGAIDWYCLTHISLFSIYLIVTTIYHVGEFELINLYHHNTLNWYSFLIYHSKQYSIANAFCMLEQVLTSNIFGFSYKKWHSIAPLAFIVMILGLSMRILSFYTAKSNFTHLVQFDKKQGHKLVTHGIYKYVRHPGYLGFFLFSVGSMLFIGNWFCAIAYFFVLSKFFKERIQYEEQTLVYFFENYDEYRRKTPTYLPFVQIKNY